MEAQRAFEDALCAEGAVPWERARAAYNLDTVHHEQGNVAEAERCFWRARGNGCSRAPYNLGAIYLETGRVHHVKGLLEDALRGDLLGKAACALGQCYKAHRCPKRARTYYERALAEGEPYAAACLNDTRVCT